MLRVTLPHEAEADILEMWCLLMSIDDLTSSETERIGREFHRSLVEAMRGQIRAKA